MGIDIEAMHTHQTMLVNNAWELQMTKCAPERVRVQYMPVVASLTRPPVSYDDLPGSDVPSG
jgi:hypothetical protein